MTANIAEVKILFTIPDKKSSAGNNKLFLCITFLFDDLVVLTPSL